MRKADILLGLQWGDEGKGKMVDVLTPKYDVVARFQGGPNAGHTLEFNGQKYVLRSIPSGIFQGGKTNLIGNGVVLDPVLFRKEVEELSASGYNVQEHLLISKKAHLILPTHRLLDQANEAAKGKAKIGTTGKGIGPTYTDKISRNGLRVGDILEGFEAKYRQARDRHIEMINGLNASAVAKGGTAVSMEGLETLEKEWMEAIAFLRGFQLVDSEHFVNKALQADKSILCEGAQGSLLDIDFGSYPFVTSSNTVCAGACTGLGIAPSKVGEVYGIFKAYCTRVGAGPFPTELFDETGAKIRAIGHEYGAVTGRERRCGWIDLVALRYTIMLNGVTQLLMMKSDVLDTFPVIKACTAYRVNGVETRDFPFSIDENVEPVYEEFPGWQTDLTHCTKEAELPEAFINYVNFLERELQTPIRIISVGPDREATIWR
jgi:adenylosuccinate synthase